MRKQRRLFQPWLDSSIPGEHRDAVKRASVGIERIADDLRGIRLLYPLPDPFSARLGDILACLGSAQLEIQDALAAHPARKH